MNSQYLYADALRVAVGHATAWLDLGCGHQFLPEWMPESAKRLTLNGCLAIGIDMDVAALRAHPDLRMRILGSIERLPFATASFDLITANMVVEHVEQPEALFEEVGRVLKPGGQFLVHTPNVRGYTTLLTRVIPARWRPRLANLLQGRLEHDVYPTFYKANTVAMLQSVARCGQLDTVDVSTVESSPQLYRVPVLRSIESGLLRLLEADSLARWRPCIVARFTKRSASTKH